MAKWISQNASAGALMSEWLDIAAVEEVPPGTKKEFQTPYEPIVIVNLDGDFYAVQDVCTHDGGILSNGWLENGALVCPRHGARFSVKTGDVLAPPAYEPINTFPVKIEQGRIKIKI
jgi:3-phenylpropionate/trans-cinnamate dioxygenase ferredoxin subunit